MTYTDRDSAWSAAYDRANASRLDVGIEYWPPLGAGLGTYTIRALPPKRFRYGVDLRCEVVIPEGSDS